MSHHGVDGVVAGEGFMALLIEPVQRIPRYVLLLKEASLCLCHSVSLCCSPCLCLSLCASLSLCLDYETAALLQ